MVPGSSGNLPSSSAIAIFQPMDQNPEFRRRLVALSIAIVLAGGSAVPAFAQSEDDARYSLQPSGEGFVRLDRRTGQMSFCRREQGQLVCRLAADERDAYEAEIGRLEKQLETGGKDEEGTEQSLKRSDRLPTDPQAREREFEQAMEYAEKALRRFFDVMRELRDEMVQGK